MAVRNKYLNNRDLLTQIHKSKITYGSYIDPMYEDYDVIVNDLSELTEEVTDAAIKVKVDRWNREERARLKAGGIANWKVSKVITLKCAEDFKKEDLVVRVMSWDHIPHREDIQDIKDRYDVRVAEHERKLLKGGKTQQPTELLPRNFHAKLPFAPYIHMAQIDGEYQVVGKSHWIGGMDNGHFSCNHGRMTDGLGRMIVLLVQRYSQKGNWRGYSYNDEFRQEAVLQLCQVGLQFNEAKSDNPFAFYTVIAKNSFTKVLNREKAVQELRDDIIEDAGFMPSSNRQLRNLGMK